MHPAACVPVLACLVVVVWAQPRKNLVLFLGADAGLEVGVYGNKALGTPNLDALAARGLVFDHAFTSVSSSSSSRSVLLTGLPQHQNGQYGLADGTDHFSSFDNVLSLPAILANNGVRTGLVGRKHVRPDSVYRFDFEASERQFPLNQIGRNITLMKEKVRQFLANHDPRPFFLLVAFNDPHRCDPGDVPVYGEFCQRLGNGVGVIPDWKPVNYHPNNVTVPYFLPDSLATRQDLADMYTAYSRLDQGIGVLTKELQTAGLLDNTLILYTSASAIPFPNAKTNLYEPGMALPLIISDPTHRQVWGQRTDAIVSTADLVPTILGWFGVTLPSRNVTLTGQSLLPLLVNPNGTASFDHAFASHSLHEATMYYPMRVLRTRQYRLLHNLNHLAPFSNAGDIAASPTMQAIVGLTLDGRGTSWFKTLQQYYYRERYELYDLDIDPMEMDNLATDPAHAVLLQTLQQQLLAWQEVTQDPWRCLPGGVLLANGTCTPSANGEVLN